MRDEAALSDAGVIAGVDVALGSEYQPEGGRPSLRTAKVAMQFGVPQQPGRISIAGSSSVRIERGKIVFIVGPSGSGKSTVLKQIERQFAGGCMVGRVSFPEDRAVLDRVAPGASLGEALSILSGCALGEPSLWLRRFGELSDGEKFRARLARAIGLLQDRPNVAPLMCDEFCSLLHRRVAKAISFNLRKIVSRYKIAAVVAGSNEDILTDLQPDVVLRLDAQGKCSTDIAPRRKSSTISFRRRICIEPGGKRDYDMFSAMHYRKTDELGFVDKVFVMRDGKGGDMLGIVVYAHPPMELALRNQATGKRFSRNPKLLNKKMRILRRLVVHPDVRGCGLGHYLVRKTMPLVGTEFIECLAGMGEINPVFEKAGMERVGQYEVSPKRLEAIEQLRVLGVDPSGREFPMQVCRRPRVRKIVASVVYDWYAATTAGGESRVEKQSPAFLAQTFRGLIGSKPVYYLWNKNNVKRCAS